MSLSQTKKWTIAAEHDRTLVNKLSAELDRSALFIQLCLNRGLTSKEEIETFLHPDESWFHDPYALYDMEKVIERISAAIESGESIMIYGDYDADGVTSTAILYETLEAIGANVEYFIPNRFVEGYGPNKNAFESFLEQGTNLIITVDNGVAGHEAIHYIQEKGIDVIVTDHHEMPDQLPDAYAIIHPNHPSGQYPFKDLSGAGVALKVATALLGELPTELLDLAAIGTVADLVALKDENRAIVTFGLKAMQQTQRVGILSLFEALSVSLKEIDETTIGFKIAPPINAIGRLESAGPVVELLTTFDEQRAKEIAGFLDQKNNERKEIVKDITAEAMTMLAEQKDSLVHVLAKEGWHEGVLGIVASRIVSETGKPTIVLNLNPELGEAKGSGRSIQAFNLFEEGNAVRNLFKHFGGHHMAAGMTLPIENIQPLKTALEQAAEKIQQSSDFTDEIEVDEKVALQDISLKAINEIEQLKPFGTENPKPLFMFEKVYPKQSRAIGADRAHLKLNIAQDDVMLDVIAFNYGKAAEALTDQTRISLVGTLEINEWNGTKKPQMQMVDLKFSDAVIIDKRSSDLKKSDFAVPDVTYVFFGEKLYEKANGYVHDQSEALLIKDKEAAEAFTAHQSYMLVDCPESLEQLERTVKGNHQQTLYCMFYTPDSYYLTGLPNRTHFSKVYKFLAKHKSIDLKTKGSLMADYLKIDKKLLKFIIRVFLDAGFVTIENGLLKVRMTAEKADLTSTAQYQQRERKIEVEEKILYSSFKELAELLRSFI